MTAAPALPASDDPLSSAYQNKDKGYFRHARREVLPFVPQNAQRILEIGCGAGATLAFLRQQRPSLQWVGGAEIAESAAADARAVCDAVWCGNVETMTLPIEAASLDVVLCLDVLEHLVDPWAAVQKLQALLKPGGVLIASLPNIQYYKVSVPLLLLGRFTYKKAGILDRTHLRFFTRRTGIELLSTDQLTVEHVKGLNRLKVLRKDWIYNVLTFGRMRSAFTEQYLLVANKT